MQQQQQKRTRSFIFSQVGFDQFGPAQKKKKIYGRNHSSWTDFRIALTSVISMLPGKFLSF